VTLNDLQTAIGDWSDATFGPGEQHVPGVVRHMRREIHELADALANGSPSDVAEEAADVVILALTLAHRRRFSLSDAIENKRAKNAARTWPGEPDADGIFQHVR